MLAVVLTVFAATVVHARDLQGRLGIGYNSQFSNATVANGTPGLSLKYAFTKDIGFEGIGGVSTASPLNLVTAVKFFKNIFYETNLNFYFMLGGGIVAAGSTGFEFQTGFGSEFFIPGIESLGLSMELGASIGNATGSFLVKTIGVSFINAGMHFYF